MLLALAARADTALTIGAFAPGPGGPCYDDTLLVQNPPQATGNFTLPGVSGTGVVNSIVHYVVSNPTSQSWIRYDYSVDMSGISPAANHCIKLLVHFGTPHTCSWDVIESTGSGVLLSSATKAPYGDITFVFGGGCLSPGQTSIDFGMLSDAQPKTNVVTIIDDYTDPASGLPREARISVTAVVPDVPPDWVFAPGPVPYPIYQGILFTNLATNSIPMKTNVDGPYDFTFRLYDAPSNGLPVGPVVTQTVQVVHGLFNLPLQFDPVSIDWGDRWLDIGVRPTGANVNFSPIGRQAVTPAPQAFYAYSAGTVSDISPDQAVVGLNSITGNLTIAAGQGLQIITDGTTKTITISQTGQLSDRNAKTDFSAVQPGEVLAKLASLPISSWRYTNETANVRHVGPMAQDFKAAFDLGASDKMIGTIDESGVALVAIQGLNQKIDQLKGELARRDAENAALQQRLDKLERLVKEKESEPPEKRVK